jgi:hypothetical protein
MLAPARGVSVGLQDVTLTVLGEPGPTDVRRGREALGPASRPRSVDDERSGAADRPPATQPTVRKRCGPSDERTSASASLRWEGTAALTRGPPGAHQLRPPALPRRALQPCDKRYPSHRILERIEASITDREAAERYVDLLLSEAERQRYPSLLMLDRARRMVSRMAIADEFERQERQLEDR